MDTVRRCGRARVRSCTSVAHKAHAEDALAREHTRSHTFAYIRAQWHVGACGMKNKHTHTLARPLACWRNVRGYFQPSRGSFHFYNYIFPWLRALVGYAAAAAAMQKTALAGPAAAAALARIVGARLSRSFVLQTRGWIVAVAAVLHSLCECERFTRVRKQMEARWPPDSNAQPTRTAPGELFARAGVIEKRLDISAWSR